MYDCPETAGAYDVFWTHFHNAAAGHGIVLPAHLTRGIGVYDLWDDPNLVVGQICNLPFRQTYHPYFHIVGAMDYAVPDVPDGFYNSVIVTRAEHAKADLSSLRFAFNSKGSNSGWDIAHIWAQGTGTALNPSIETGGHLDSLRAILTGQADVAAIDFITFRQLRRFHPDIASLVVRATTPDTPGMLLVTRHANWAASLRRAANEAILNMPKPDQILLGLNKIVPITKKMVLSYAVSGVND